MENNNIFKIRIKQIRTIRKLTQKDLAIKAKVTTAAMSHFEKGNRTPTLPVLLRLSHALEVSIDYLVGNSNHFEEFKIKKQWKQFFEKYQKLSSEDREKINELVLLYSLK